MPIPATEDLTINYDYVVSANVVQNVRRLLATGARGASLTICRSGMRPSILNLAGLGREIWNGVSVRDYIHELRGEWDAH